MRLPSSSRAPSTCGRLLSHLATGTWVCLVLHTAACSVEAGDAPVLRASDVVFMYDAPEETYAAYGATVLAWGGTPDARSRKASRGIRHFGSVGMVTEFERFHRRFPDRYTEALCRDVDGNPVKVPWLTDHQSQGVPYWWCCTRQPVFLEFLRERVVETLRAGADGLHVDDHLGTAGGLWLGLCFCDRCLLGFRAHLATMPPSELVRLGVTDPAGFDFRAELRRWRAEAPTGATRPVTSHPLWAAWTVYQCRGAAAVMLELRELAARTAGRRVPVGANAGLLWPRHLADFRALDLFTAETDHHAAEGKFSPLPLLAYRLAEAMGRPYAATASGQDWAWIKAHNKPGLVRGWIAFSYAAGQRLMAPHRQWCYTPEKGTHWYAGPAAAFAPLYQFVRAHAALFDDHTSHADLVVVLPHRAFLAGTRPWFELAERLTTAGIAYRVLLGGDEIVDHPLDPTELAAARHILAPVPEDLLREDRERLERRRASPGVHVRLESAVAAITPACRVISNHRVRLLPRVRRGGAVVHVLNWDYDPGRDEVRPAEGVTLRIDLGALGLASLDTGRLLSPDQPAFTVPLRDGVLEIPRLGLWSLLVLGPESSVPDGLVR